MRLCSLGSARRDARGALHPLAAAWALQGCLVPQRPVLPTAKDEGQMNRSHPREVPRPAGFGAVVVRGQNLCWLAGAEARGRGTWALKCSWVGAGRWQCRRWGRRTDVLPSRASGTSRAALHISWSPGDPLERKGQAGGRRVTVLVWMQGSRSFLGKAKLLAAVRGHRVECLQWRGPGTLLLALNLFSLDFLTPPPSPSCSFHWAVRQEFLPFALISPSQKDASEA